MTEAERANKNKKLSTLQWRGEHKKKEIVKQEVAKDGVARQYSPSFKISIADCLQNLNRNPEV